MKSDRDAKLHFAEPIKAADGSILLAKNLANDNREFDGYLICDGEKMGYWLPDEPDKKLANLDELETENT